MGGRGGRLLVCPTLKRRMKEFKLKETISRKHTDAKTHPDAAMCPHKDIESEQCTEDVYTKKTCREHA